MNKNNRLVILGGGFISTSIKNYFNEKAVKAEAKKSEVTEAEKE